LINGQSHTAKSTSSLQEEMAHLPAATTATSTPTTPEHVDHRRRLRAHTVDSWSREPGISCKLLSGCKQVGDFLIRRTRECCASKFVREQETKDARTEARELLRYLACFCVMNRIGVKVLPAVSVQDLTSEYVVHA
jgi:hypothetical protein